MASLVSVWFIDVLRAIVDSRSFARPADISETAMGVPVYALTSTSMFFANWNVAHPETTDTDGIPTANQYGSMA